MPVAIITSATSAFSASRRTARNFTRSRSATVPTNFSLTPSSGLASNLSGSGSMPLVKNGKITNDAFVHVADDAAIPADGAVLISAARFLENAEALSQRVGRTGVIWPNNHDLDDLVPYLDRLA